MKLTDLHTLFEDQLKDLYSAEKQLIQALPKMAKRASHPDLTEAFESHLEETRGHADRLTALGDTLEIKLGGKKCKAMEGLIEEGKEMLEAEGPESIIDAGLIGAAQRVEHYEIAAYGTARAMAEQLGLKEAVEVLQGILDQEGAADKKLTEIALGSILPNTNADDESDDGNNSRKNPGNDRNTKAGAPASPRKETARTSRVQ